MCEETVKILAGLEKIENSLAKIYRTLSEKEGFSKSVRNFWETISQEELRHALVFKELREKLEKDPEFCFSIDLDWDRLKIFADKAKAEVARVLQDDLSESEAYSLGAMIEAELDESRFLKMARTDQEKIQKKIERIEAETRKHRMIMTNYAKGVR